MRCDWLALWLLWSAGVSTLHPPTLPWPPSQPPDHHPPNSASQQPKQKLLVFLAKNFVHHDQWKWGRGIAIKAERFCHWGCRPFPLVCKINLGYKCALAGPVLAPDTNKSRDIAFTMINISFYGRVTGAKYGAKRG